MESFLGTARLTVRRPARSCLWFSVMELASFLAAVQIGADAPQLPVIARAAAEVAGEVRADLVVGGVGVLPQQGDGVHHKAGVAEAALVGALPGDEAHKTGGFGLQALQRLDRMARGPRRQHGAGEDRLAVHQDGAQAAARSLAPALDAGAPV